MNNLTTKIKISVVFSLIAAGVVLTGCASKRSARSAGTDTTVSTAASSTTAAASDTAASTASNSASSAAAQTSAGITGGNVSGQAPIAYDVLMGLIKQGQMTGTPSAQ